MRVAVLTLTRDRLGYTKDCFNRLAALSGCDYDHFVLDNGSADGTQEWLQNEYAPHWVDLRPENIGISRGLNALLDVAGGYDVIVKFDNDCELVVAGTLKAACDLAAGGHWLVSPHIHGLDSPPNIAREETLGGYRIGVPVGNIGGIFLAAPASLYTAFRHDEANPVWGMDDVNVCAHWRQNGGEIGYLLDYPAWHYETTQGQRRRYRDYFVRKDAEYAA